MRAKEFLNKLEHDRIVSAIRQAESKTSGEIRVYIHRGELNGDPLPEAQKKFHRLRMQKTKHRNGVLIFVAPRARQFAVIGDRAIHERCGEEFWHQIVSQMREHFRSERFTDALVEAIAEIGRMLTAQFPASPTLSNELPDEIVEE